MGGEAQLVAVEIGLEVGRNSAQFQWCKSFKTQELSALEQERFELFL